MRYEPTQVSYCSCPEEATSETAAAAVAAVVAAVVAAAVAAAAAPVIAAPRHARPDAHKQLIPTPLIVFGSSS